MHIQHFSTSTGAIIGARANVFQHSPYEAHVVLQSKRKAAALRKARHTGRVTWGNYSARVVTIDHAEGRDGCPCCCGLQKPRGK